MVGILNSLKGILVVMQYPVYAGHILSMKQAMHPIYRFGVVTMLHVMRDTYAKDTYILGVPWCDIDKLLNPIILIVDVGG